MPQAPPPLSLPLPLPQSSPDIRVHETSFKALPEYLNYVDSNFAGTHGNGVEVGNLATLVTRLEYVSGKGEVRGLHFS